MSRFGLAAAIAAIFCTGAARADPPGPNDAVPGHPGVTYLSLLKQEIPDLAADADGNVSGHLPKPLHNLAGKSFDAVMPDPVTLNLYEAARVIVTGGQRRLVIMADLGPPPETVGSVVLLALYDDGPKPKLLDAVDVGLSEDNGFAQADHISLGAADEALITYSEHSNTSTTDSAWLALFVRHDRFQLISHLAGQAERACGWERTVTPSFAAQPDAGRAYPAVEVTARDALKHNGEDCGDDKAPAAYARTYRVTYHWNAAANRYEAPAAEVKALQKLSDSHFPDE